ncbi:truncated transcription factor CAULIFLOWER A-like [Rutidosis leptorrhynchoides]|uniref:truncated transcription factor CAULIFLOWER A-like n=1 Tax=Rutidosis leptorrhynchoides TaxID=125765 RepID=UPI003A99E638
MGRGKVELKRIEDKSSRQVSFSKRRNGLMKKAHELAVLCDVDVALFVFSGKNRLFEYSSGESMPKILARYQDYRNADEIVRRTVREKLALEYGDVPTADELTQMIQCHLEERKIQHADVTKLCELEKQIESSLQQVRFRKNQLMMDAVKALKEKHYQLNKEKHLMVGEIIATGMNDSDAED